MTRVCALVLALLLAACAAARVSPDGSITAWALGTAKVERCVEAAPQQRTCTTVAGGPLSEGLLGTVGGLLRAVLPAALSGGS